MAWIGILKLCPETEGEGVGGVFEDLCGHERCMDETVFLFHW